MMRNKYSIYISISFLLITGCSTAMSDNITKFEWDATESGPKHYPMEIITGSFIYKDEIERGLYIPSGGTLRSGWGKPISSHVTGEKYKPLPDRLTITYFSYAEKQFYKGEFKLPYDKILTLFKEGVAANKEMPTYSSLMAGVAPGGAVSVWVFGTSGKVEVFFGQANKIELDPSRAFSLPFESKEQSDAYIAKQLVNSLSNIELESLRKNGIPFGLWERYRNLYEWQVVLSEGYTLNYTDYEFVNGESNELPGMMIRPVPKQVSFKTVVNNQKMLFIINFDEFEIMDAFEKLGKNNQKVYMEFEPRIPRKSLKVRIYNDKKSIALKKYVSDDW